MEPRVTFLPSATLRWVASCAGGSRVVTGRRMVGGITSAVHRLTVADASGTRRHVVLRRWVDVDAVRGRRRAQREARVLEALARERFPAPELVAVSDGRDTDGTPAVLMTRAPGHVHLTPSDPEAWLRQAAEMLPRLHDLAIEADASAPAGSRPATAPAWVSRSSLWAEAHRLLAAGPPSSTPQCFVHGDYQHFNLLWRRERLVAVVDWVRPLLGSPDLDVSHCRLNLAVLFGVEFAEKFRLAYEAAAGRGVDPWFDVNGITRFSLDWLDFIPLQVGGRATIDITGMPRRVESLLAIALRRA